MNDTPSSIDPPSESAPASPQTAAQSPGAAGEAYPHREGMMARLWREWLKPLLLVLLVMSTLRSAVADWNDVPTGSMKPTIVEGDRIFVNKAAYDLRLPFTRVRLLRWAEPQRGDIVVLFSPDDGKRLVKRVIGVPGDELELRRGKLFINDQPAGYGPLDPALVSDLAPGERNTFTFVEEEIGDDGHPVMLAPWPSSTSYYGPVTVPPAHYFVMGDNRSRSRDSRVFGFVARPAIVGQATAVVFSLDRQHHLVPRPRWDRFFQALP
jgi:signal peptidase I